MQTQAKYHFRTDLQSMMNARLSQKRFSPCHEERLIFLDAGAVVTQPVSRLTLAGEPHRRRLVGGQETQLLTGGLLARVVLHGLKVER